MTPSARYFSTPETIRYDPAIRDYVTLPSGEADIMHPVDQRVALCLSILQGTISGDNTLGNRLKKISRLGTADSTADAKRCVMSALEDVVNDGQITVLDIVVIYPNRGRMDIYVTYRNEILSKSLQPITANVTIGGSLCLVWFYTILTKLEIFI